MWISNEFLIKMACGYEFVSNNQYTMMHLKIRCPRHKTPEKFEKIDKADAGIELSHCDNCGAYRTCWHMGNLHCCSMSCFETYFSIQSNEAKRHLQHLKEIDKVNESDRRRFGRAATDPVRDQQ